MVKIERILVPTDFSAVSLSAIRYALSMASSHGAEVIVLHAVSEKALKRTAYSHFIGEEALVFPVDWLSEPQLHAPPLDVWVQEKSRHLHDFLREKIEPELLRGLRVVSAVRLGEIVGEIVGAAEERRCDLIVMTSRGRSRLGQIFSKSLTQQVVKLAPCPVLSIQPSAQVRTGRGEWVPIRLLEKSYA